jgi:radical SAM-linked protein
LDKDYFPAKQIVPYVETVHNRLTLEVARGCPGKCRFCQASKYYWPWRLRAPETILSLVDSGLSSTGYEEVSFASLSCTDYRGLEQLLEDVNRRFGKKRINITLPSLRCDQFSLQVAGGLGYNKRASLTFAPEAGTERLRFVIGKNLTEQKIQDTLLLAWRMGWRLIKLYFMIGLPTETEEDIDGIRQLIRSVRSVAGGLNFNVTISPFVPKPQTSFQWVAMAPAATLLERLRKLEKILPASVKSHYLKASLLEGVFARGDRRLSAVIYRAWKKGCKFDQWKEQLKYDIWESSFAEEGISTDFYLYRERKQNEVLPWDHLIFGVDKNRLWTEYQNIFTSAVAVPPAEPKTEVSVPPVITAKQPQANAVPVVQRLRLRFARSGVLRFLSHLEQIELLRRAIRRADLPVAYTAGFSPQIKMAFGPAVSVGYESRSEYVEIDFVQRIDATEIQRCFSGILPEGLELLSVKKIPLMFPSLDALLNVAEYSIQTIATEQQIDAFLAQNEIIVEKQKGNRVDRIDAKPLIRFLKKQGDHLLLQLRFGPKRNVKPEKLLPMLLGIDEQQTKLLRIARTGLFIEKQDGSLSEP